MKNLFWAYCLASAVLLTGCLGQESVDAIDSVSVSSSANGEASDSLTTTTSSSTMFSDRDFEVGYDESVSAVIQLNGDSAYSSSNAVQISGSTVTIIDEGTYILSGALDDGMIIVNSEKTDKTQLVLNGVDIHSETGAPIYILQSDKVFITTAADTTNKLSNGGTFTTIDENNIDGVIFSKEDLTLNGSGSLIITSPAGNGIVSKDSLKITSGSYDINCASHAIEGKDDVCIANADFIIVSGKDGIHADNADDASLGFVYIQSGVFNISAEGDGISASASLQIENGSFNITAGGGSVNGESHSSGSWGSFMGGGRHQGAQRGGPMGANQAALVETTDDTTDSVSMKGIKAAADLVINGGEFTINSADDSVHSNTSITINGGVFEAASGDDAFHADEALTVTAGTIRITESYEGLEALHVNISGGDISLAASDDGINAAGGADASGMGGRDGMFNRGMPSSSDGSIVISGGTIDIEAYGDGIDANGTLDITGGYITVCGPNQGNDSTLDYDLTGTISGGTFIGTGASGMAQTFSDSTQGVISVNVGNQSADTVITLTDANGNTLFTHTPKLDFSVVILSSPDLVIGETYTLTVGSTTGEFVAG